MAIVISQEVSSSSSTLRFNYQVFLSFRGEDTRKTFTDHLHTALVQAGLRTFRDNDEIERGKRLELELRKAIQESRISIIVFSKNYASSKWCLDEVLMILEWSRAGRNEVLPIFFDVDPSDVWKQTGSIGDAFVKFEKELIDDETDDEIRKKWTEKLKKWRVALEEFANLTGMVLENEEDGYEAKFIQKVVRVVEDKLRRRVLHVGSHLVGIHSRTESINSWVQDNSTNVKILIISGMGGIGKTTIAKYIYNLNHQSFESSVFLSSVREESERHKSLVHLQQILLSNILKQKKENVYSVDEGIVMIEDALSCKKVLIVLDDVTESKQLDTLLGTKEFYPGSKIIITTRYKWLLKAHQVHKVHTIEKLDDRDSSELFSWHAFGNTYPNEGYKELSEQIVCRCGGLPLACEVLGSSLSGKSKNIWKSTLEKLEAIPDAQILKQLKLSYDSLQDDHDKQLFLHIACFFVGNEEFDTVSILNKCGFFTEVGIENLVGRCLIAVNEDNKKVMMHQFIQEMGREIVDQESRQEPGRRSRLWRHKDSLNVLKDKKGTETIEGLFLDMHMMKDDDQSHINDNKTRKQRYEELVNVSNQADSLKRRYLSFLSWQSLRSSDEIELTTDGFAKMEKLLFLQLNYVQLTGCYDDFPQKLRWLCWHGFSLKSLPMNLPLGNVIALDLSYSNLNQVWKSTEVLGSLKILNLSHCIVLAKTPDFSTLPNLLKLILEGCIKLTVVCESIGSAKLLNLLNLKGCKNLKKFPNISKLKFLETLIISGCSHIVEFIDELKDMESLKVLRADGISINNPVPDTSSEIVLWNSLYYTWLSKPRKNINGFWHSLPRSLITLSLVDCNLSNESFPVDLYDLVSLQDLDLSQNPIRSVPEWIKNLTWLKCLKLNYCSRLQSVLVTNVEHTSLVGSRSVKLQRIEMERLGDNKKTSAQRVTYTKFSNLLELDFGNNGFFKFNLLEEVDREILNNLGFFNFDLIRNLVLSLGNACRYHNEDMDPIKYQPIKGLHECGIFSTFIPKRVCPSWCSEVINTGSSLSFTVPSSSPNTWIQCLNMCTVYSLSSLKKTWNPPPIFTRIENKTKDLIWIYRPWTLGIPQNGDDDVAWLSQWKFGNLLESGDEVRVSVVCSDELEVKEFGTNLVWGDKEIKTSHNMSSDFPERFVIRKGVYFVNNNLFLCKDRNDGRIPSWFGKAFVDVDIYFEEVKKWCRWEGTN